jgi:adenine-specific DNA-methyltransferase
MRVGAALEEYVIKARGAHYTPPELASFLARSLLREARNSSGPFRILDPACGDGSLLLAAADAAGPRLRKRLHLVGLDTHQQAVDESRSSLRSIDVASVEIHRRDFLLESQPEVGKQRILDLASAEPNPIFSEFDAVIANPPYVRTQVLGSARAQQLAQHFGLSGRVDLYHAFLRAISCALRKGGVLGLLTSNRFLMTQAGAAVRHILQHDFDLLHVMDLGDTKLFAAAVLPAIAIARRASTPSNRPIAFARVYRVRGAETDPKLDKSGSILEALDRGDEGLIRVGAASFRIERGLLRTSNDPTQPWSMSSKRLDAWNGKVKARTACFFGDVGKIRVGIKTTADTVFIRRDWDSLPLESRPEDELLQPLVTHRAAARWRANEAAVLDRVLYPHTMIGTRRAVVDLDDYPRARNYLRSHYERLSARKYVIEAGRSWYELWVPQCPSDWALPKIVFPDISETTRFFLDDRGAIVNGDSYWITLRTGKSVNWIPLMLAVANSSFMEKYYDMMFNNKLYAGRRRFLTQYVEKFPLPDIESSGAKELVRLAQSRLLIGGGEASGTHEMDAVLDEMVWELFGLVKETSRERNLELSIKDAAFESLK